MLLRGEREILDEGFAGLYEVETRSLVRAAKTNTGRFPANFVFRLSDAEAAHLRSQSGLSRVTHPEAPLSQGRRA